MKAALPLALIAAGALTISPGAARDAHYIGAIDVSAEPAASPANAVQGRVFLDENRNSILDDGEAGVAGVAVSNGREVVQTDAEGRYMLPAYGDMNVFITKPAGYAVPLSKQMVPQFAYVYKEAGSPPLRFGGLEPTGPLPAAVNFPLIADAVGDTFEVLAFGDPQTYSNREIGYMRDTVAAMLAERDTSNVEFLIFEGDVMGDDLSLFDRFKDIIAAAGIPQYFVAGNHDLDFDATLDADSFDTFRREWGPEYYSFDVGKVHFVVLDNVRYPCNGIDKHPFCAAEAPPTYNGVIAQRQLDWLANDLRFVPQDRLVVLNAHVPFQSFADANNPKSLTDNLAALADILGDRPVLGLSGHTHTTENISLNEEFAGWENHTGVGPAPFAQIVTGAVSAAWWGGDLNDQGIPRSTQRLGSPRGYYALAFDGPTYVDTYAAFGRPPSEQFHVSFNTPRFRKWATALFAFADHYPVPSYETPPVTLNDLGDVRMVSTADLAGGTWVALNVWNGAQDTDVAISINDGAAIPAQRTQAGKGEGRHIGPEFADPYAIAQQATQGRLAWRSARGGADTAGFEMFKGRRMVGKPGPLAPWMLARMSSHLWRADLPADLAAGVHTLTASVTDRHGRTFEKKFAFEVVDRIPDLNFDKAAFK